MSDETGFLKFPREAAHKQHARERIRHWHEYEEIMDAGQAQRQARRCMDCGTPDCHRFCPVHNLIPDWNELVGESGSGKTSPVHGGFGLGLPFARDIARAHGGDLVLKSPAEPESTKPGACFVLTLPALEGGSPPSPERPRDAAES